MNNILFFSEETTFTPPSPALLQIWLRKVSQEADKPIKQLHYIFCSDPYLHAINQQHLQHNTLTDIITFDYADNTHHLEGDLYISVATVQANAKTFNITFAQELCRVMVHGLLHLIGYNDKKEAQKKQMRDAEDRCLTMPSLQQWLNQHRDIHP